MRKRRHVTRLIKSNFFAYRWEQRPSWCWLRSSAACDLWFRVGAVGVEAVPDASGGPRSSVQLVRRYTGYGGVFRPRSRASPDAAWWRTAPASALQLTEPSSDVNKTKFLRPRPRPNHQNNKTKTTGSKQRHLADLTFRQVNQHISKMDGRNLLKFCMWYATKRHLVTLNCVGGIRFITILYQGGTD